MINKNILIIAYKYPPYAGVGGFRWSKLSKYLAREGCILHVVTIDWLQSGLNTLSDDIQHQNIVIHRINSHYPHKWKNTNKDIFFIKLIKKIAVKFIDKYIYWDDEAQYWGKSLIPAVENLIAKYAIQTIIATGHPFETNYWASVIKKRNPNVKLIQDFRDPWLQHEGKKIAFPYKQKAKKRMDHSLQYSDVVVTITKGLQDEYVKYNNDKIYCVISNGYDPEAISLVDTSRKKRTDNRGVTITHIGNITNGRDLVCDMFLHEISQLVNQYGITIKLAGYVPKWLLEKHQKLIDQKILQLYGVVPQQDAQQLVADSDFALQLNAKVVPYLVSTKIYEYGALGVPCISLNYGGEIERLISESSLGYTVNLDMDNLCERLLDILENRNQDVFEFRVQEYSFEKLAKQYKKLI